MIEIKCTQDEKEKILPSLATSNICVMHGDCGGMKCEECLDKRIKWVIAEKEARNMIDYMDIINEIGSKIYNVLRRGYEREELTVLVPTRNYNELLFVNSTVKMMSGDSVATTVLSVTVKPIDDLDKIYVCL